MMPLPPPAKSLWREQEPASPDYPALLQDCAYDIAIIGGGYTGLHAAHTFADAGLSVIVLEAGEPGIGGSGRNGGVVSAKFRRGFSDIARSHGLEMAQRMHTIATASVEHLTTTLNRFDLSNTGFRRVGALKCAHSAKALYHARQEADWLRNTLGDTGLHVLCPEAVAEETGSSSFVGGVLQDGAGTIQPLAYLLGLWRAAKARGIGVFAQTAVQSIAEQGGRVVLTTPGASVIADRVLLATNAYSWLTPAGKPIARSIVPFRSAMVATEPLPDHLDKLLLPTCRSYTETRRMMRWFRKVDGRVIFGGRGALGAVDAPAAFRRLEGAMRKIFPELHDVPIALRWSGQVALTFDGLPQAGLLSNRIGYAAGFNGAGVAMSGFVGDQIARRMTGQPHDLALIARASIPKVPFYPLRAIAVRSTTFFYEMLDAAGL
ncbi:MAG: oxidoreductase [Roseovarius sp. BRH_c41]|nr:MAG: oxidoreductase [Roseovarius sp. BRH_c41]